MTLLLSNEEIAPILESAKVIEALESGYKDLAAGKTDKGLRMELDKETDRASVYYNLKTMTGCWPRHQIATTRIVSDLIAFENDRRRKITRDPGKRWVGLVLVFSLKTGGLLAVFTEGAAQRMRVGLTNALGAKYLSRETSKTYGLIGTGFQAEAQLKAICSVRPIEQVKVFSLTESHRKSFAEKWSRRLGLEIRAVDGPEQAVKGSDIVGCATNSAVKPVIMREWLEEGMFVTSLRANEIEAAALQRCDIVAIHAKESKRKPKDFEDKDAIAKDGTIDLEGRKNMDGSRYPDLMHIISGQVPGRQTEKQITAFVNNKGIGFQFTVIAHVVLEAARQKGIGRLLPDEWFTQSV